ncbi:molecular chaperone [Bordetella petrii]|uniref:fimbrial biogenesis chaperone n=1 Tax=Bordetella petrii TaxID=94624 RepID=UPI001E35F45B|nr:molecular chaperone [Bordetella petrii]MCD0502948.1 molecular chaperone [Bordetella petrii]
MNALLKYSAALAAWAWLGTAAAAVVIHGTRVIIPGATGEATVQLRNESQQPVLIQAWIDDGDASATPQQARSPFVLTPPVARVEAQKGQALRLIRMSEIPERQRESLFWLNVVETPPKPTENLAAGDNILMFSFRTRIKVFYRPAGLAGDVNRAHEALCFNLDAGARKLRVFNPTPFHITFRTLVLRRADGSAVGELPAGADRMVPPASSRDFDLPLKGAATAGITAHYSVINDFGGETSGQRKSSASCTQAKAAD